MSWVSALLAMASAGLQPNDYRAGWVALPQTEIADLRVAKKAWYPIVRFRPRNLFVLDQDVVPSGKASVEIAAGTRLVGLTGSERTACELERPRGIYNVGCLRDQDGDGRYETFFRLNHGNPFFFNATRQPRQKDAAIAPVSITSRASGEAEVVELVVSLVSVNALSGRGSFSLCILRPNNQNIWGDKSVARGCLPPVTAQKGAAPTAVLIFGRAITFGLTDDNSASVSVSGMDKDVPVWL